MTLLQEAKYELLLSNIKDLMLERGIIALKISDIAKELSVGEATIYRYFGTKTSLVIEVGILLWDDIYKEISSLPEEETGYKAVTSFFRFFLEGYKKKKEVFVFLDEFDSFMMKESVKKETLQDYDQALYKVKEFFTTLFKKGLEDGSIVKTIDENEFYYTSTHMILGICKKLASSENIVGSDDLVSDVRQIELALDICIQYIKNRKREK